MEQFSILLLAFLFGLAIGSFLNVVIIRLPKGESIAYPASHCVRCGTPLKWYHNIPLLSWLALRGKCAFCGEPISAQYPLVELLTALIFASVFYKLGLSLEALLTSLVFTLLLALSLIDLRYKAVPDSINLLALTLAIFATGDYFESFKDALLMAGGFALLRFYVSYYVSKKEELHLKRQLKRAPWLASYYPPYVMIEAMGEGDIMVAATMGAVLGIKLSLIAIFLAALFALPASLINRALKNDKELPFIPFLALGMYVAFIFQKELLSLIGVA